MAAVSGLKLVIPTSFTDVTLPVLRDDAMLSAGSLGLYEIGHPLAAVTGVPANNWLIPNIAFKEASALIPGSTASTLSALVKLGANDPAKVKIERTGKGGLHGIISKAAPPAADTGYLGMYGRAAIAQYIRDNIAHEFFISYWGTETRAPNGPLGAFTGLSFAYTPSSSNLEWTFNHDSNFPSVGTYRTGSTREVNGVASTESLTDSNSAYLPKLPAKVRLNVGVKGSASVLQNNGAAVEAADMFKLFSVGNTTEIYPHPQTGPGSAVHYRTYIEDLTVSGRTYAQADAIDKAEYTKHVLTSGGRYYSDTWTDPATLL